MRTPLRAAALRVCFGLLGLAGVLGLWACSGSTRYVLTLDGLSFVPETERAGDILIPAASDLGLDLYILPGFQITASGAEPDPEQRAGIAVEVPLPQPPPPEVQLRVEARGRITVTNLGALPADPKISGVTIELYLDGPDSTDIYGGGSVLALASHPAIDPGETAILGFSSRIEEGQPLYPEIAGGRFRLGIKVSFAGDLLGVVPAHYAIEELAVEISGYPFGYIP